MHAIQNDSVSVVAGMRVARIWRMPSAQVAAASSAHSTPQGVPESTATSCQSSSTTPPVAASTPSKDRKPSRSP